MRVIQLLPTLSYGDGVSGDALAIDDLLKKAGYDTMIYAENIDRRIPFTIAKKTSLMKNLKDNDIIIYHLSTGTRLNYRLSSYKGRKLVVYHNVTPPDWYMSYNIHSARLCKDGIKGIKEIKDTAEYCLADSEFNKEELLRYGYDCPIDVLPILIAFDDYDKDPDPAVINKYKNDGYTNILFTGRIAPNKKQEDVIESFYYYKKYYNPKSRLFLVGSYRGMENYYDRLCDYVSQLGVEDVIFTGHIKFEKILAYYRLADIFLCMSEHEGFCIPLVEAMYFHKPIIAYCNTGITGTLAGSGLGMKEKDPLLTAGLMHRLMTDETLRCQVIEGQDARLRDFDNEKVGKDFLKYLEEFIGENR